MFTFENDGVVVGEVDDLLWREGIAKIEALEARKDPIARVLYSTPDIAQLPDINLFAMAWPTDRGRLVLMFPPAHEATHEFFDRLDARDRVAIGFGVAYYDLQDQEARDLRAIAAGEGRPLTPTLRGESKQYVIGDEEMSALADVRRLRNERHLARVEGELPQLVSRSFSKAYLAHVLVWCQGRAEHYMTQNTFCGYRRVAKDLHQATSLWVDLDYYKLATKDIAMLLSDDADAVDLILFVCAKAGPLDFNGVPLPGIPAPTQIVRSGRGIYCKWMFDHFLTKKAATTWKLCQTALFQRFAVLGADPKAKDVSRVLRVIGSTNSNADGATVRLLLSSPRQSFSVLASGLLARAAMSPQERHDHRMLVDACRKADRKRKRSAMKQRAVAVAAPVGKASVTSKKGGGWPRFVDGLKALINLRMSVHGTCQGHREHFVFWICCLQTRLGRIMSPGEYWHEAGAVAASVGSSLSEVRRHLNLPESLGGSEKPYMASKAGLIEFFGMTRKERDQIPEFRDDVVARPSVKRPRVERATAEDAYGLAAKGLSRSQIAAELKVSLSTLRSWFAKHRAEQREQS